jgi:hypothetical protein
MNYGKMIDAGIAWLNANRPNWREMLNKDSLNLADPADCILGQTGGYLEAVREAVPAVDDPDWGEWSCALERDEWATAHGFRVAEAVDWDAMELAYEALTAEWLTKLNS